jgi:RES domain
MRTPERWRPPPGAKSQSLSSSAEVPAPEAAGKLDPLVTLWDEGRRIVRCHSVRHGPAEFNRTASPGRFRPVRRRGRIVGTLYGSEELAGAVSETVFHNLPVGQGERFLRVEALAPMVASTLSARRVLRLASLHGHGLRRLGATRAQLIDSEADQYPALAAWGQALHDCRAEPDGLMWRSRHYDDAYALLLFADRVRRRDVEVIERPLPLALGRGLERLMELAERAGITLVE